MLGWISMESSRQRQKVFCSRKSPKLRNDGGEKAKHKPQNADFRAC